jgi:uncharacterized protein YoxC
MSGPEGLNAVFMQIGELAGSVQALHEKIDGQAAAADRQGEFVQAELRNIKHDVVELQDKHNMALNELSADVSSNRKMLEDVSSALNGLRKPVEEIMTLRARAMGALLILGPIGAAALYLIPMICKLLTRALDMGLRGRGS